MNTLKVCVCVCVCVHVYRYMDTHTDQFSKCLQFNKYIHKKQQEESLETVPIYTLLFLSCLLQYVMARRTRLKKEKRRWACIQCIDFTNTCIRFQKQHYPITSTAWPAEPQSRHLFHLLNTYSRLRAGVGVAQLVECLTEKPGTILMHIWVPGAARVFLPQAPSSANSLTVSVTPRAQSHATTSVRMLKIPNTGSHTIVWTHENNCTHW